MRVSLVMAQSLVTWLREELSPTLNLCPSSILQPGRASHLSWQEHVKKDTDEVCHRLLRESSLPSVSCIFSSAIQGLLLLFTPYGGFIDCQLPSLLAMQAICPR